MAKSTIKYAGDNIVHVVGVRLRVLGEGFLRCSLHSIEDVNNYTVNPIIMSSNTNKPITKLANIIDSRIQLQIMTNDIDEIFGISNFYIYAKPIAISYPIT